MGNTIHRALTEIKPMFMSSPNNNYNGYKLFKEDDMNKLNEENKCISVLECKYTLDGLFNKYYMYLAYLFYEIETDKQRETCNTDFTKKILETLDKSELNYNDKEILKIKGNLKQSNAKIILEYGVLNYYVNNNLYDDRYRQSTLLEDAASIKQKVDKDNELSIYLSGLQLMKHGVSYYESCGYIYELHCDITEKNIMSLMSLYINKFLKVREHLSKLTFDELKDIRVEDLESLYKVKITDGIATVFKKTRSIRDNIKSTIDTLKFHLHDSFINNLIDKNDRVYNIGNILKLKTKQFKDNKDLYNLFKLYDKLNSIASYYYDIIVFIELYVMMKNKLLNKSILPTLAMNDDEKQSYIYERIHDIKNHIHYANYANYLLKLVINAYKPSNSNKHKSYDNYLLSINGGALNKYITELSKKHIYIVDMLFIHNYLLNRPNTNNNNNRTLIGGKLPSKNNTTVDILSYRNNQNLLTYGKKIRNSRNLTIKRRDMNRYKLSNKNKNTNKRHNIIKNTEISKSKSRKNINSPFYKLLINNYKQKILFIDNELDYINNDNIINY